MNPEPRLIRDCIKGKRRAQFEMYKLCYPVLMGVCRRYRNNEDEVSAMVNSGFLKILNNLKKYSTSAPFEAWIRRIMINLLIDDFRKYKKEKETIFYAETDVLVAEGRAVDFNDAEKYFDASHIESIINSLPGLACQVFNLFAIDGFSHKEIGEQLDISEGTSKWYLSEARKKIREQLAIELKKTKVV
jgi:RNA polymerase sigma factor (sigma-70 family)